MTLKGKSVVITGAGRGIGREIALLMAKQGARVVVNDYGGSAAGLGGEKTPADEVVNEIRKGGGEAVANYESVATMAGGQAIVKTAVDAFGRVDVVVNNAGILRDRMIFNMTEEEWDAVIDTHLKGTFAVTRAAAPLMREQRWGRVINMTSTSGLIGNVGQVELCRREARHPRAHQGHGARHGALQRDRQLHLAVRVDAHDRHDPHRDRRAEGARREDQEAFSGAHRAGRRIPRFGSGEGYHWTDLRGARQGDHALQPRAADHARAPRGGLDGGAAGRDVPRHAGPPSGAAGDVRSIFQLRPARVNVRRNVRFTSAIPANFSLTWSALV